MQFADFTPYPTTGYYFGGARANMVTCTGVKGASHRGEQFDGHNWLPWYSYWSALSSHITQQDGRDGPTTLGPQPKTCTSLEPVFACTKTSSIENKFCLRVDDTFAVYYDVHEDGSLTEFNDDASTSRGSVSDEEYKQTYGGKVKTKRRRRHTSSSPHSNSIDETTIRLCHACRDTISDEVKRHGSKTKADFLTIRYKRRADKNAALKKIFNHPLGDLRAAAAYACYKHGVTAAERREMHRTGGASRLKGVVICGHVEGTHINNRGETTPDRFDNPSWGHGLV